MNNYPIYSEFAGKTIEENMAATFLSPILGEEIVTEPTTKKYKGEEYTYRFLDPNAFCHFHDIHWLPDFCEKHKFGMFVFEEKSSDEHAIDIYVTEDPNERILFDDVYGLLRDILPHDRVGSRKAHLRVKISDTGEFESIMGFWKIETVTNWTQGSWHHGKVSKIYGHYRQKEKQLVISRTGIYKTLTALKLYFGLWDTNDEDFDLLMPIYGGDEESDRNEVRMNYIFSIL